METRTLAVFFGEVADAQRRLLLDRVTAQGGRSLKRIGTAELCVFDQAREACRAAEALQKALPPLAFRIGISLGEITVASNNAFGAAVNLAARLQGIADAGQVFISEEVMREIEHDVPFRTIGRRQFAETPEPLTVYALGAATPAVKEESPSKPTAAPQAPPHELFDFSRADQERLQDDDSIAPIRPSAALMDSVLSLADDGTAPSKPQARRSASTRPLPDRMISAAPEERKRKLFFALAVFLALVVVLPALLVGALWGLKRMNDSTDRSEREALQAELSKSIVLQTMKSPSKSPSKTKAPSKAEVSYGSLLLRTSPSGAAVFIDDRAISQRTPVLVKKIEAKVPFRVRVEKPGYEKTYQFLNLDPNEERELEIKLPKSR